MSESAATEGRDAYFTMRLPQSLVDELKQVARENERSLSAEARLALKAWLQRYDQDQAAT